MKYKYFIAEGPQKAFEKLWNSICGKKPGCSWEDNPCVRAVEFEIKEAHMPNKDWEVSNTDQYGQQLTEQNITWVEWDGDVEHLPKIEGTPILVKFLKYNAINSGVLKFDFSDDEVLIGARIIYPESGGYDPIEKGDQFAVVGEDSHAS